VVRFILGLWWAWPDSNRRPHDLGGNRISRVLQLHNRACCFHAELQAQVFARSPPVFFKDLFCGVLLKRVRHMAERVLFSTYRNNAVV